MRRFKSARHLQLFTSVHDQVANLFTHCRYNTNAQQKQDSRDLAYKAWEKVSCAPCQRSSSPEFVSAHASCFRSECILNLTMPLQQLGGLPIRSSRSKEKPFSRYSAKGISVRLLWLTDSARL